MGQGAAAANDGSSTAFAPDVEMRLTAGKGSAQILPGTATNTWGYRGEVIRGDSGAVQALPGTSLGPILRLRQGQKVRIHLKNELDEATNIHWHGLIVPPAMDGHPKDIIAAGETYVYEFEVKNRAGTYWFHPHPHGRTGPQVNMGLAGLVLVSDDEEQTLGLPTGDFDVPLVIQDRTFDANHQFVYGAGGMDGMMDQMMGFLGDRILVNGQVNFTLPVATSAYRLRLLNGSNARVYKLAWSNGLPMTIIASDGGLLAQPVERPYVTLGPGERVDLWVDFSTQTVGAAITLQSLAHEGVEAGMMMNEPAALPNGAPFDVLTVHVEQATAIVPVLPAHLAAIEPVQMENATNAATPRTFELAMNNMQWLINGKSFEMDAVAEDEKVGFGNLEVWEFINQQGAANMDGMTEGGMMNHGGMGHNMGGNSSNAEGMLNDFMAHPMHIHGVQFRVIGRQIAEAQRAGWETLQAGFVDEGWKDTVLVMPGERVKLLMRFADYAGMYLVHCHNLEHEDLGMMRNYLIE
jgi:FtsP/CotA-like multicopper oxidase with cupredoxin domain